MSRFFAKISPEELREKMDEHFDDGYPGGGKVSSDLRKVDFDFENFEDDGDGYMGYPCGIKTLENGMTCCFVNAGGDWETPICFVVYWDGKNLRAYIPERGNVWNRIDKCAFGNDEKSDEEAIKILVGEARSAGREIPEDEEDNIESICEQLVFPGLIIGDVMARIVEKNTSKKSIFRETLKQIFDDSGTDFSGWENLLGVPQQKIQSWLSGDEIPPSEKLFLIIHIVKDIPDILKNFYRIADLPLEDVDNDIEVWGNYKTLGNYLLQPSLKQFLNNSNGLPFETMEEIVRLATRMQILSYGGGLEDVKREDIMKALRKNNLEECFAHNIQ